MLECEALLEDVDVSEQLAEIDNVLLEMMAPLNMRPDDPGNAYLALEAYFEKTCIDLERLGVADPGNLSLYAFYSRIQHFQQKPQVE
jgi:hypothetical protein